MTEEQPYTVLRRFDDFELRQYPHYELVQVSITGEFAEAPNRGFRPLFQYISGNNKASTRIAMTAPVFQETAASSAVGAVDSHTISFVLPAGMTSTDVPVPSDSQVTTKTVTAHLAAARRFSGRWRTAAFQLQGEQLRAAVTREGLVTAGEVYFSRFDPPWKPSWWRRNEALIVVTPS